MYGGARKDATNIWILNNQFKFRMLEKEEKQVREECSRSQQAAAAEANSLSKIEGEFTPLRHRSAEDGNKSLLESRYFRAATLGTRH